MRRFISKTVKTITIAVGALLMTSVVAFGEADIVEDASVFEMDETIFDVQDDLDAVFDDHSFGLALPDNGAEESLESLTEAEWSSEDIFIDPEDFSEDDDIEFFEKVITEEAMPTGEDDLYELTICGRGEMTPYNTDS